MVTQYYIFEIQQYVNGEYGHLVHYAFDQDPTKARLKAESRYHEVLAAAAISEIPQHSASLIATDGRVIMYQCYVHDVYVPEPEPTPEPEPEPTPDPEVTPEPEDDGEG